MNQYDLVISDAFLKKAGKDTIEPSDLEKIFIKASQLLAREKNKANCLLYPGKPREHEAKQIMSTVLTELNYNHMVERPVKNPIPDLTKGSPLMVDIAIYTRNGIIDIEFKRRLEHIKNDFPKLFSSTAIGCALFYIFCGQSIDFALTRNILKKYQQVYNDSYDIMFDRDKIRNKWFRFFVLGLKEQRMFSKHYDSIKSVDFNEVASSELVAY